MEEASYTGPIPPVIGDTPPSSKKRGRRWVKGCLITLAALFVVFITAVLATFFYLRTPHFRGTTALVIDIRMEEPFSGRMPPAVLLDTTITNGTACASVLSILHSARFRMDHKCADIGSLIIHYTNGKTDSLRLLPGHDPARYEFRHRGRLYRLDRERFYKALRTAGVDTSKVPATEH